MSAEAEGEGFEHPEDKAARLESEAEAKRFGAALLANKTAELQSLLLTYADAEAADALERLRSRFWGEALPAAAKKAKEPSP